MKKCAPCGQVFADDVALCTSCGQALIDEVGSGLDLDIDERPARATSGAHVPEAASSASHYPDVSNYRTTVEDPAEYGGSSSANFAGFGGLSTILTTAALISVLTGIFMPFSFVDGMRESGADLPFFVVVIACTVFTLVAAILNALLCHVFLYFHRSWGWTVTVVACLVCCGLYPLMALGFASAGEALTARYPRFSTWRALAGAAVVVLILSAIIGSVAVDRAPARGPLDGDFFDALADEHDDEVKADLSLRATCCARLDGTLIGNSDECEDVDPFRFQTCVETNATRLNPTTEECCETCGGETSGDACFGGVSQVCLGACKKAR